MDTNEKKNVFLKLLRNSYLAQKQNRMDLNLGEFVMAHGFSQPLDVVENPDFIFINEQTLREHGFGDNTFWKIICPALKNEECIREFSDPEMMDWEPFYLRDIMYEKYSKQLDELRAQIPPGYTFYKATANEEVNAEKSSLRGEEKIRVASLEKEIEKVAAKRHIQMALKGAIYDHIFKIDINKINKTLGLSSSGSLQGKNFPKSIHLVTSTLGNFGAIYMVLDGLYEMPIRFEAKNHETETKPIKKLFDIVYAYNVSGKGYVYSKRTADSINNDIFKKLKLKTYIKTNGLNKPTLVRKSVSGNLVLQNDTPIQQILVNKVPSQFQHLYKEKTK